MKTAQIKEGILLKDYSTFGIGGPAKYFAEARTQKDFEEIFSFCQQESLPFFILGKGSNSLFDERGFDGCVILNKLQQIKVDQEQVLVESGYSFSRLGVQTARNGFSGLEFASGIPATVGGAVFMNAGASGKEVCEFLSRVHFLPYSGQAKWYVREELDFSYRYSSFQKMEGAILAAEFILTRDDKARETQKKIIDYRTGTQPYGELSCGCIFRNPEGGSAGALIDQCGLKGKRLGGAAISEKHANFIVNAGGATSQDVLDLIEVVRKEVEGKTGIRLECEIRQVPYKKI